MAQTLEKTVAEITAGLLEGVNLNDQHSPTPELHINSVIMAQVKAGMTRAIMAATHNNQSKSALILGINRATMRTRLKNMGSL